MEMTIGGARPISNVVVCHRNKVLVSLGKLQAERHGIRVHVARNGLDALAVSIRVHPELIVLSNDLENPDTKATITMLESEPRLQGVRVVTVQGAIPNLRDMLGRHPGP